MPIHWMQVMGFTEGRYWTARYLAGDPALGGERAMPRWVLEIDGEAPQEYPAESVPLPQMEFAAQLEAFVAREIRPPEQPGPE